MDGNAAKKFLADKDVVLTTYGWQGTAGLMATREWRLIALDEAQAIKNPGAKQTRAVKRLRAHARVALSGTPVENRLGDLWSLYDFLNPGLLGGVTEFSRYVKKLQAAASCRISQRCAGWCAPTFYAGSRRTAPSSPTCPGQDGGDGLVRAEQSRRLGSTKRACRNSRRSWTAITEGIQRRGLVLAFLMRFKQPCNHPSQWLGDGAFTPEDSGKFQRLADLCEEIASRQEKVLVFTQFREMTEPLASRLGEVFGQPGLVLHGATPVKERQQLVAPFQREEGRPFSSSRSRRAAWA